MEEDTQGKPVLIKTKQMRVCPVQRLFYLLGNDYFNAGIIKMLCQAFLKSPLCNIIGPPPPPANQPANQTGPQPPPKAKTIWTPPNYDYSQGNK